MAEKGIVVHFPQWVMMCVNDECGVIIYDLRRDITLSCPGCDELGVKAKVDG